MSYCGDMKNDNTLKELFGDRLLIDPETGVVDRDSPEFIELLKITPRPVFDELRRLAHLWKEQREREIRRSKELAELLTEIAFRENRIQELEAQAAALREALFAAREKALYCDSCDWAESDKTVFALSAEAGTNFLDRLTTQKIELARLRHRLQAAEAVCESYRNQYTTIKCPSVEEAYSTWYALKAKGE